MNNQTLTQIKTDKMNQSEDTYDTKQSQPLLEEVVSSRTVERKTQESETKMTKIINNIEDPNLKELFLMMLKDNENLRNEVKELKGSLKKSAFVKEGKKSAKEKKPRKKSANYLGTSDKISPAHKKLPEENCYRIEEWTRRTDKATANGKFSAKAMDKYAAGTVRTKITFYYSDDGEDIRFTSLSGIIGYVNGKFGKTGWKPYGKKVAASHYIKEA